MVYEVVFSYALSCLLGITLLFLCKPPKRNDHPSLKGEQITPLPGDTPSAYFQLPTNQSAYGSVMQDPKNSKDSKDSKDKEPALKKAEKTESKEGSVSKDGPPKESKKDGSKQSSQLKEPRKSPST